MTRKQRPRELRNEVIGRLETEERECGHVSDESVALAARDLGYTPRHVRRLLQNRREGALEREPFTLCDDMVVYLFVTRGNCAHAYELLEDEGYGLPSLRTFQQAVKDQVPAAVLAMAKKGMSGFRARCVYLKGKPTHRNHTWYLDASELPIEVLPDGAKSDRRRTKAWIVTVIDGGKRYLLGWSYCLGSFTAVDVRNALIAAARARKVPYSNGLVTVGGVCIRAVWDNGKQFLADLISEGCLNLAIAAHPAPPYAAEYKAIQEVWYRLLKQELDDLIGNTRAPKNLDGKPIAPVADDQLLSEDELRYIVGQAIEKYNSEHVHSALGTTPIEAWADDPTPLRMLPDHELWEAMLESRTVTVQSYGVRLRNADYFHSAIATQRGKKYEARFLKADDSFIELFYNGRHVCTALKQDDATDDERGAFLNERNGQKRVARATARKARTASSKRSRERAEAAKQQALNDEGGEAYLRQLEQRKANAQQATSHEHVQGRLL